MSIFNYEDFVENLPDAFYKKKDGNNYKLMLVEKHIYDRINEMFQSIFDILEIDNAKGSVLDMYGERLNLKRGTWDDTQYLIQLKSKIAQSMSDGSRNSIAKALAFVLSSTTDRIQLKSREDGNGIEIADIPLGLLYDAKFEEQQIIEIVESLLPQGVHVLQTEFSGTFEFGETETEYDETKGFADLEGTIGGYFGLLSLEGE